MQGKNLSASCPSVGSCKIAKILSGLIKQLTAAEQLLKEVTPIDDGECGGLRIELSRQHLHLGGGQNFCNRITAP